MADQPQLGYGNRAETSIDTFNQWFRSQPEYYAKLREFGQDPRNVHLNDYQKQQMVRLAQSLGAVVDEGNNGQEVDDSGNFRAKSHALRNTLIVAGIAGAALLTAGAAGVFGGGAAAGGGAASGAGAAAAGGVLPSTAIGTGFIPAIAGGTGLAGAGTAAGVGAAGAGLAGAAEAGSWDAAGNFIGPSTVSSVAGKSLGGKIIGALGSDAFLRYGLPVAGGVASSLIAAHAAGAASDAEQKYLEEALAYAKEKDAGNVAREAGRYADYKGNIASYLANGQASGSQMAKLLGLSVPSSVLTPRGAPAPLVNSNPYFDPSTNITPGMDLPLASRPTAPTAAPMPPQQQPMVTIQAPNGQTKQVTQADADHYVKLGATILQGAA